MDHHHAAADFGRWVQLRNATIGGLHSGPNAERAKAQGERIALALHKRPAAPPEPYGGCVLTGAPALTCDVVPHQEIPRVFPGER